MHYINQKNNNKIMVYKFNKYNKKKIRIMEEVLMYQLINLKLMRQKKFNSNKFKMKRLN